MLFLNQQQMKNKLPFLILIGFVFLLTTFFIGKKYLQASLLPGAKDIVQKSVNQTYGEKSYQAEWGITAQFAGGLTEEISLKIWQSSLTDKRITLVTAPARLRGNAFLRIGKEVWYWEASEEKLSKLSPAALAQTWLNTHLTLADLTGFYDLSADFAASFKNLVKFNNAHCYLIELVSNQEAALERHRIMLWINTQNFIIQKAEYFNEDDFLAVTALTLQTQETNGRTIPKLISYSAPGAATATTQLTYKNTLFNQPFPENFFTIDNLKKVR